MQQEGDFVRLLGPVVRRFHTTISRSVKPSLRKFDKQQQQWLVHWRILPQVAAAARSFFEFVDWSALPPAWQSYATGTTVPFTDSGSEKVSPFATIFVTEDAPMEVVKAAYRALAKCHHPDSEGSDGEQFKQVSAAYEKIVQIRGK